MATSTHRYAFNGGEVHPSLHYRPDLERYYSSCRKLENVQVGVTGEASRRLPIETVARIPIPSGGGRGGITDPGSARVLPFAADSTYLLVFYYSEDIADTVTLDVYSREGTHCARLETPYSLSDLPLLRWERSMDIMYLVHPDYPPYEVRRLDHAEWEFEPFQFEGGPWLPVNTDQGKILMPVFPAWTDGVDYKEGQHVWIEDNAIDLDGNSSVIFAYKENDKHYYHYPDLWWRWHYYYTILPTDGTHSFAIGDRVKVSGTSGGAFDGVYTVKAATNDTITINTGVKRQFLHRLYDDTYGDWVNYTPESWVAGGGAQVARGGDGGLWECVEDHTSANEVNNPNIGDEWRQAYAFDGQCELKSSFDYFTEDMVGGKLRLDQERDELVVTGDWEAAGESTDPLPASGTVKLTTAGGEWGGTIELQESTNGGVTWETLGAIHSHEGDNNGVIERETESSGKSFVRAYMKSSGGGVTGCKFRLEVIDAFTECMVTIIEYTDTKTVTVATDNYLLGAQGTHHFAEGAWSDYNGWPGVVGIHEERLFFASTDRQGGAIWLSETDNWVNFFPGTLATSPFTITISGIEGAEKIMWVKSEKQLLIGTDKGEVIAGARNRDEALFIDNLTIERHEEFGSAPVAPATAGGQLFFLQAGRRRIRMLQYLYEDDAYNATDIVAMAEHVTGEVGTRPGDTWGEGVVREMAWQSVGTPALHVLRSDGTIYTFTYDREQKVFAWAQQIFAVDPSSVTGADSFCITPPHNGGDEIIYMLLRGSDEESLLLSRTSNYPEPCLDFRQTFTVTTKRIYPYYTNEDAVFYDSIYLEDDELEYTIASGTCFLVFPVGVGFTSIGGKSEGTDWWYVDDVSASDKKRVVWCTDSSPTVKDEEDTLVEGTDYYEYSSSDTYQVTPWHAAPNFKIASDTCFLIFPANVEFTGIEGLVEDEDWWYVDGVSDSAEKRVVWCTGSSPTVKDEEDTLVEGTDYYECCSSETSQVTSWYLLIFPADVEFTSIDGLVENEDWWYVDGVSDSAEKRVVRCTGYSPTVKNGDDTLVEGQDYYEYSHEYSKDLESYEYYQGPENAMLVFGYGPGEVTMKDGNWKLIEDYEMLQCDPAIIFPSDYSAYEAGYTTKYAGTKYTSKIWPVDLLASAEGGPGKRSRVAEVELFLVNSVLGEVSADEGRNYQDIRYLQADSETDVRLPLFTGRKVVQVKSRYLNTGDIRIQTDGLYPFTVACIGLNARRYD